QPPLYQDLGAFASTVIVGDFDGDGKLDLVVDRTLGSIESPPKPNEIVLALGNGDGTFKPGVVIASGTSCAIGDFNADGKLDLVTSSGLLLGNGNGTFRPLVPFGTGNDPNFVGVGDFDSDGKLDLALVSSNAVTIMLGNGDGT